tara:strand:- start:67 stop:501 length:435 start_codon:yes stop_codon:yes gene_type:complete
MKITKARLKEIIKEELARSLNESDFGRMLGVGKEQGLSAGSAADRDRNMPDYRAPDTAGMDHDELAAAGIALVQKYADLNPEVADEVMRMYQETKKSTSKKKTGKLFYDMAMKAYELGIPYGKVTTGDDPSHYFFTIKQNLLGY